MKKGSINYYLILMLFLIIFSVGLCFTLLSADINEFYTITIALILITILSILGNKVVKSSQNEQQVFHLNEGEIGSLVNKHPVIQYIIIFFSIGLIPKEYFMVKVVIILFTMMTAVYFKKMLVFNEVAVRNVFHWSLKWDNIKGYDIDEDTGVLSIYIKDSQVVKYVRGIDPKDYLFLKEYMDAKLS